MKITMLSNVNQLAARISHQGNSWVLGWDWCREPSQELEAQELNDCIIMLQSCNLSDNSDGWNWKLEKDGAFSIASCRHSLSASAVPFYPFEWCSLVPKKVNLLVWRSEQERIPTLDGLTRRRIISSSDICSLCNDCTETAEHLFISCYFATQLWSKVSEWCRIPPIFTFEFRDILRAHKISGIGPTRRKIIKAVILSSIWVIWTTRNKKIFSGKRPCLEQSLGEIQSVSYNWITNRGKHIPKDWNKWISFDLNV